ncbi:MAG TPA: hypothetical protein VFN18_02490 [Solirubrobacterales bacterium]|nr:hypothetical protein [Solirubrobacterales bacterium]
MSYIVSAGLAVLAFTAAVGSGAAFGSETVLCDTDQTVCPTAEILPAGSSQIFAGTVTLTLKSDPTVKYECQNVGLGSKTTVESGEPLAANSDNYPWTTYCKYFKGGSTYSCEAESLTFNKTPNVGGANHEPEPGGASGYWKFGSSTTPLVATLKCLGEVKTFSASQGVIIITQDRVKNSDAANTLMGYSMTTGFGETYVFRFEGEDEVGSFLALR